MAAQAPKSSPHPPELPFMPDVSDRLSNYLRQFSLWAKNGLAGKIDDQTALPGHLLQTYDTLPGSIPKVYKLQVSEAGVAALAPVPLGKGPPGTPVPITGASLPLAGGTLTGPLTAPSIIFSPLPHNAANDAAAAAAGVPIGGVYRNANSLMVRTV